MQYGIGRGGNDSGRAMKCYAECEACGHIWLSTIGDNEDCPNCGENRRWQHRFDLDIAETLPVSDPVIDKKGQVL